MDMETYTIRLTGAAPITRKLLEQIGGWAGPRFLGHIAGRGKRVKQEHSLSNLL